MLKQRNVYLAMKGLDEARRIFEDVWSAKTTTPEVVAVEVSLGRVTAAPVFAALSAPSYHSAAMDGIAVRAEETYGTTEKNPRQLTIGKDALWINTGQALPEGYNAVIMIEKVHQIDDTRLEILAPAYPWQNIRKVGEDIVATQLLLPQNHVIRPYDMGAMATAGIFRVAVRKRPLVTIIPTGTELIRHTDITDLAMAGKNRIIESNSITLSGLVREAQGEPKVTDIVPDTPGEIRTALLKAAASADLVLINAGSSAGSKDYTASIIKEIGEVLVHGVTMMPGKPTILGTIDGTPVIGIPGYTVSAVLAFEQFARPLIFGLQGLPVPPDRHIPVKPSRDIPSKLGTEEFIRVNIGRVGERLVATPLPRSAGSVTTLTRAEGIIRIPAMTEGISQEDEIDAQLMVNDEELSNTIVIIGSHDITLDILADEIRRGGRNIRISSGNVGSLGGLMAIRKGICHIAGSHLLDTASGEYNVSYIKRYLKGTPVSIFRLALRDQGLIIPKGNPKGIRDIHDLTRPDITFINRQAGSGTRILLDYNLERAGIDAANIKGYEREEYTHMSVAVDVLSGAADCGMAIYASAKALGLDFIPMDREEYELVIPTAFVNDPNIQTVLDTIRSQAFRERVAALGGYDPSRSGEPRMEMAP